MTWEWERRVKRVVLTALFAAACTALAWSALHHAPAFIDPAKLREQLIKLGGWIIETLSIIQVGKDETLQLGEWGALAGVFLFAALLGWKSVAPWLHDRAFAAFRRDLLLRIDAVRDSGGLPWTMDGDKGVRRKGWDLLTDWFGDHVRARGKAGRYKMAIIVGRSGSGKTRMAEELGLFLARRGTYRPATRRARMAVATGAWLRRVLPLLRPRAGDPWDFAIVHHLGSDSNKEEYLRDLADWQPRRPTMLLLDDPAGDDARRVHDALSRDDKRRFRHPVVLMVANQTVPQGCPFLYDTGAGEWTFDGKEAVPQPVKLPAESWFDPGKVARLLFDSGCLAGKSESLKDQVRDGDVHRVTGGNPLLVVLAIEWIREKGTLEDMTEDALKAERANRILTSLSAAGVDKREEIVELLVATLAGGGRRDELRRAYAAAGLTPGQSILDRSVRDIQPCFPSDAVVADDGSPVLPPIRPEMVVAAFCDAVVRDFPMPDAELDRIVEAACHLNLARTLRTRRRLPPRSRLGEAMARLDPRSLPHLAPLQWAIAEVEAALFIEQDELRLWTQELQDDRIARADTAIAALTDPRDREDLARHVAKLTADRRQEYDGGRRLLPYLALRFVHEAIVPKDVAVDAAFLTRLYESVHGCGDDHADLLGPMDGVSRICGVLIPDDRLFVLLDAIWDLPFVWKLKFERPLASLSASRVKSRKCDATFRVLRCYRNALLLRAPAAARLLRYVARIASNGGDDRRGANLNGRCRAALARAWADYPEGTCAKQTRTAANAASTIALRFPKDAAIQRQAAEARRYEAYAWSQRLQGECAEQAQTAAARVSVIALPFPKGAAIQREAADARRCEAYAWSERPRGECAEQARTAADAVSAIALSFPKDAAIQRSAIEARRCEAYAWCQRRQGSGAEQARAAAAAAWAIALSFPEDAAIQREAAEARCCEAYAWSQRRQGSGAEQARTAAAAAWAIALSFPEDAAIQREAAEARYREAHAWSQCLQGLGAEQARTAADAVWAIALLFPEDTAIQREAADARHYEAYAWSRRRQGSGAEQAQKAASEVASVASPFSEDAEIQLLAVAAYRYETYAWNACPRGAGAVQAREAADKAQTIAERFQDDPEIQAEAQKADQLAKEAEAAWRAAGSEGEGDSSQTNGI